MKDIKQVESSMHRTIKNGIYLFWRDTYSSLKDYSERYNYPTHRLDAFIKEEVILHPKFDEDGFLLMDKKKRAPNGTLYVNKEGILSKWVAPKEVEDHEDEYNWFAWLQDKFPEETMRHPNPPKRKVAPKFLKGRIGGVVRSIYVSEWEKNPFWHFRLAKYDGIWYMEEILRIRNLEVLKRLKQLNKKELKEYGLKNENSR